MSEVGQERVPVGDMELYYQCGCCLVPSASNRSILKDHLAKDHVNVELRTICLCEKERENNLCSSSCLIGASFSLWVRHFLTLRCCVYLGTK